MIKSLFTTVAVCATISCFGQTTFKQNDIYLEAGGNGLFGSLNYERQLTKQAGLGARIGFGFYTENALYLTIPVGLNYLFRLGNNKSFIDAGLAVTWTRSEKTFLGGNLHEPGNYFASFVPGIGYRRHTAKNLMWRVSLTPIANKFGCVPWIGASIGKRF